METDTTERISNCFTLSIVDVSYSMILRKCDAISMDFVSDVPSAAQHAQFCVGDFGVRIVKIYRTQLNLWNENNTKINVNMLVS